jgi:hypothetical protein
MSHALTPAAAEVHKDGRSGGEAVATLGSLRSQRPRDFEGARKAGRPVQNLQAEIAMAAGIPATPLSSGVGLDESEIIAILPLSDVADWHAYEAARQKLIPNLTRADPAARYRVGAAS